MSECENCVLNVETDIYAQIYKYYSCPSWVVNARRFLQFGDLVFDGKRTVENYSTSIRTNLQSYLNRSGSLDMTCDTQFDTTTLSITVEFAFTRLNKLDQQDYVSYIKRNLLGLNRLWAVDTGGKLIWTWARMTSFSENQDKAQSVYSVSLEFTLPTGVWYIADLSKVYVEEYDRCDEQRNKLVCQKHCLECTFSHDMCDVCNTFHDDFTDDMLFCNNPIDVYWECQAEYRLLYDCASTDSCNLFASFGLMFLQNHATAISGTFCSNTIAKGDVQVTLFGTFHDPEVTVNGRTIRIKGDYTGIIQIDFDGTVMYYPNATDNGICDAPVKVPLDNIEYCSDYFELISGENELQVIGAKEVSKNIYTNMLKATDKALAFINMREVTY